jgi:hypothetical protein
MATGPFASSLCVAPAKVEREIGRAKTLDQQAIIEMKPKTAPGLPVGFCHAKNGIARNVSATILFPKVALLRRSKAECVGGSHSHFFPRQLLSRR